MPQSYNPMYAETDMVWAAPVSLATTPGITFVFSSYGYLDVSVPHVRLPLCNGMARSSRAGLPHSDIRGSIRICQSPRLFAAYHVLLRLPEPRHPPCALFHFSFAVRSSPTCLTHRETGYDKYTLASLILCGLSFYCHMGQNAGKPVSCYSRKSFFNELFYFVFCSCFSSSCQRSLFRLSFPPLPLHG